MKLESALTFKYSKNKFWWAHIYLIFERLTDKEFSSWKYFALFIQWLENGWQKDSFSPLSVLERL